LEAAKIRGNKKPKSLPKVKWLILSATVKPDYLRQKVNTLVFTFGCKSFSQLGYIISHLSFEFLDISRDFTDLGGKTRKHHGKY